MEDTLKAIANYIRIGAAMHPQANGIRHAVDHSTCVLGALEDGAGITDLWGGAEYHFQILYSSVPVPEPIASGRGLVREAGLMRVMADLNNGNASYTTQNEKHTFPPWTREQIADWLETLPEPK